MDPAARWPGGHFERSNFKMQTGWGLVDCSRTLAKVNAGPVRKCTTTDVKSGHHHLESEHHRSQEVNTGTLQKVNGATQQEVNIARTTGEALQVSGPKAVHFPFGHLSPRERVRGFGPGATHEREVTRPCANQIEGTNR